MLTNSEKVREFSNTVLRSQNKTPINKAEPLTKNQVTFLIKMIIDESVELLAATGVPADERKAIIENIVRTQVDARADLAIPTATEDIVLEQADAIVDIEYYMKDVTSRNGINTDAIFDIVHKANMNKRQLDGTFMLRADGKVMKPNNWVSPEEEKKKEICRQIQGNSFNA